MKKFLVKLGLLKKSIPDRIEYGYSVVTAMTANPNFATPFPALPVVTTATNDLKDAFEAALTGNYLSIALLVDEILAWDAVITALGHYVDGVAQGSESIIVSAGMETRKQRSPVEIPGKVLAAMAKPSDMSGEIKLSCKTVRGKKVYHWYMKLEGEPDTAYKLVVTATRGHAIINGLQPGLRYRFVCEAVNSKGTGPLSDSCSSYAL
jgi:hypothetical protein